MLLKQDCLEFYVGPSRPCRILANGFPAAVILLLLLPLTLLRLVLASASFGSNECFQPQFSPARVSRSLCDFRVCRFRWCGSRGDFRQYSADDDTGRIQCRRLEQAIAGRAAKARCLVSRLPPGRRTSRREEGHRPR